MRFSTTTTWLRVCMNVSVSVTRIISYDGMLSIELQYLKLVFDLSFRITTRRFPSTAHNTTSSALFSYLIIVHSFVSLCILCSLKVGLFKAIWQNKFKRMNDDH